MTSRKGHRMQETEAYPEHEKLKMCRDRSQTVGEFLQWLESGGLDEAKGLRLGGIELAYHEEYWDRQAGIDGDHVRSNHLTPLNWSLWNLLAAYFEIDNDKIEDEKRAMLEDHHRDTERGTK